jgi:hypothetical protein
MEIIFCPPPALERFAISFSYGGLFAVVPCLFSCSVREFNSNFFKVYYTASQLQCQGLKDKSSRSTVRQQEVKCDGMMRPGFGEH